MGTCREIAKNHVDSDPMSNSSNNNREPTTTNAARTSSNVNNSNSTRSVATCPSSRTKPQAATISGGRVNSQVVVVAPTLLQEDEARKLARNSKALVAASTVESLWDFRPRPHHAGVKLTSARGRPDQPGLPGRFRETNNPREPLAPIDEERDQEVEDLRAPQTPPHEQHDQEITDHREPPASPDDQPDQDDEALREPPDSLDEEMSDRISTDDSMSNRSQRTLRDRPQDDGWARRSEEEGPNIPYTYSDAFMRDAETAWSFNPARLPPIGAKSRPGHHFVLVSPDGSPRPTSYFVTNSFVGLSVAIVENPRKAASNAPLAIRIKDRELSTGTILIVHQLSRVLDRMGNPIEFQYADTPLGDCVVNGWLKPTAIAEQYHIDPQTTNKVHRELAAVGKPRKKAIGGLERWTTPVLSRSFPFGALATNHSISWKFNDIPQGGSLVHAAIFMVQPGSGLIAKVNRPATKSNLCQYCVEYIRYRPSWRWQLNDSFRSSLI
ncbi:hypothetical protein AAVH_24458 [Aphelenchoides avenae]|nr:hypothetical protein AAVH_24458 [Aphelenchus avenae]